MGRAPAQAGGGNLDGESFSTGKSSLPVRADPESSLNPRQQTLVEAYANVARDKGRTPRLSELREHGITSKLIYANFVSVVAIHSIAHAQGLLSFPYLFPSRIEPTPERLRELKLLAELGNLAAELGRGPTFGEIDNAATKGVVEKAATYIEVFGSIPSARRKLFGRLPDAEERKADLLDLASRLGHSPTRDELSDAASRGECLGVGGYFPWNKWKQIALLPLSSKHPARAVIELPSPELVARANSELTEVFREKRRVTYFDLLERWENDAENRLHPDEIIRIHRSLPLARQAAGLVGRVVKDKNGKIYPAKKREFLDDLRGLAQLEKKSLFELTRVRVSEAALQGRTTDAHTLERVFGSFSNALLLATGSKGKEPRARIRELRQKNKPRRTVVRKKAARKKPGPKKKAAPRKKAAAKKKVSSPRPRKPAIPKKTVTKKAVPKKTAPPKRTLKERAKKVLKKVLQQKSGAAKDRKTSAPTAQSASPRAAHPKTDSEKPSGARKGRESAVFRKTAKETAPDLKQDEKPSNDSASAAVSAPATAPVQNILETPEPPKQSIEASEKTAEPESPADTALPVAVEPAVQANPAITEEPATPQLDAEDNQSDMESSEEAAETLDVHPAVAAARTVRGSPSSGSSSIACLEKDLLRVEDILKQSLDEADIEAMIETGEWQELAELMSNSSSRALKRRLDRRLMLDFVSLFHTRGRFPSDDDIRWSSSISLESYWRHFHSQGTRVRDPQVFDRIRKPLEEYALRLLSAAGPEFGKGSEAEVYSALEKAFSERKIFPPDLYLALFGSGAIRENLLEFEETEKKARAKAKSKQKSS